MDGGVTWALLPILSEVQGDPTFTTFGEIGFSGMNGIITGWNIPPRPGGPDWMEPERAAKRRQLPSYGVMLETIDGGKTWTKSEASVFRPGDAHQHDAAGCGARFDGIQGCV